jgi:hypothetical protein
MAVERVSIDIIGIIFSGTVVTLKFEENIKVIAIATMLNLILLIMIFQISLKL